jgi:hypothetical protein
MFYTLSQTSRTENVGLYIIIDLVLYFDTIYYKTYIYVPFNAYCFENSIGNMFDTIYIIFLIRFSLQQKPPWSQIWQIKKKCLVTNVLIKLRLQFVMKQMIFYLQLVTGRWFSPGTLLSSINKTNRHDITEILLKVALNTISLNVNLLFAKFVLGWKAWMLLLE